MKNEDEEEWFDALAGKTSHGVQTSSQIEASSIRRVLLARRASIEKASLNFDSKKLEPIKRKLLKEGFLQNKTIRKSNPFVIFTQGLFGINSRTATVQIIGVIAAFLFVVFALRVTYLGPKNNDAMLLRGDANTTYIIDEKSEERVSELVEALTAIKAEFTKENQTYGKTLIKIKSSDEVLAVLIEKRFNPKVVDGYINIIFSPPKVQSM